jgi:hypothetical protein
MRLSLSGSTQAVRNAERKLRRYWDNVGAVGDFGQHRTFGFDPTPQGSRVESRDASASEPVGVDDIFVLVA